MGGRAVPDRSALDPDVIIRPTVGLLIEVAMARTLNVESHAIRRDAFLDAAQRLIQTRGYEQMSIGDILAELDASRGAFYHYFESKEALLDAVVDRMADQATTRVQPLIDDQHLTALRSPWHQFITLTFSIESSSAFVVPS